MAWPVASIRSGRSCSWRTFGARPRRWYPAGVRIGLLVSGTGSIAAQMLDEALPVAVAVADRACPGLELAARRGCPAELVERRQFGGFGPAFDRDAFSATLVGILERHRVDLVVMAGFGTVVGAAVHDGYRGRVMNTHPSLLPAHPGWHAVADALASGERVTGCTVHLAELAVDQGPILVQQEVPVMVGDSAEELHERIKVVERQLYPATVHRVLRALAAGVEPRDLVPLHGTLVRPLTAEQVARAEQQIDTGRLVYAEQQAHTTPVAGAEQVGGAQQPLCTEQQVCTEQLVHTEQQAGTSRHQPAHQVVQVTAVRVSAVKPNSPAATRAPAIIGYQ